MVRMMESATANTGTAAPPSRLAAVGLVVALAAVLSATWRSAVVGLGGLALAGLVDAHR
jgi:hypothetical protein